MADYSRVEPLDPGIKKLMDDYFGVMRDYLNIVFYEGQWWVTAKMWEKVGEIS